MTAGHIAVIDIGKTNAKLALVDGSSLAEIDVMTRPNAVLPGPPYPHFDTEGHWRFLCEGLATFHERRGIEAISITTHGACAALLTADGGLAAPILDYEFAGPDDLSDAYNRLRPDFQETGSPRLAGGLNIGAQIHWQFAMDPGLRARTQTIVTYPQYWGFRLTGVRATDVTSLGCHTDLWNPHKGEFSTLVDRLDLQDRIAPPLKPGDVLGTLLPEVVQATGLDPATRVFCGIHDSNASLLPHILANAPPFSVISTGTWVVAMSVGGKDVPLDAGKDVLINVNALGQAVPSARFMGGREHDLATGGPYAHPDESDLAGVLDGRVMLLPSLAPETGPFRGQTAEWVGSEPPEGTGRRGAAVALYLALVTAECLENIGHRGPIIVEGPFAQNRVYLRMLSAVTGAPALPSGGVTGTSQGAAMLGNRVDDAARRSALAAGPDDPATGAMRHYAKAWRSRLRNRRSA